MVAQSRRGTRFAREKRLTGLSASFTTTTCLITSGRITLNGKALTKASVTFTPIPSNGVQEPGPSSAAITDENVRETLKRIGQPGRGTDRQA